MLPCYQRRNQVLQNMQTNIKALPSLEQGEPVNWHKVSIKWLGV